MQRVISWETRFQRVIEEATAKEFNWAEHDCCMFVCDAVLAIAAVDLAEPFRAKYSDKASAYEMIREYAGGGLVDLCVKRAA